METKSKKTKVYKSKVLEDFFTVKDTKEYKRTENNMLLALRIEKAMQNKGWNRVQFAKAMKVSNSSVITKWLSGTHNFTSETLFDIQDVLDICLINTGEPQHVQTIVTYQIQVVTENQSVQPHPYSYFDGNLESILNTPKFSYGKS